MQAVVYRLAISANNDISMYGNGCTTPLLLLLERGKDLKCLCKILVSQI